MMQEIEMYKNERNKGLKKLANQEIIKFIQFQF